MKIINKIRNFLLGVLRHSELIYFSTTHEVRELLKTFPEARLEHFGYKAYSQNDEDGIIAEIFHRIGIKNHTFVEFGVEDGRECNTALLLRQNWYGLWIEGNKKHFKTINYLYENMIKNGRLYIKNEFITATNINSLINDTFQGEIDLLSIDIDGNDIHIWEAIKSISARVVVIEYNALYPADTEYVMPYDEKYVSEFTDSFGASLKSINIRAEKMGYILVATNISGSNAFFVRKDLAKNLFYEAGNVKKLYNPARYYLRFYSGHPVSKVKIS